MINYLSNGYLIRKKYSFSNSIHACKLFYFGILHTYIRRFLFTFRHSPDRRFRFMNITHSPSTCVDLIISHNSTVRVVAYKVNIIICYPHLENCRIPTFQGEIKIIHRFCFVGFCLGNIRVNVHCSCMIFIYDVSLQFVIYSLIFIE